MDFASSPINPELLLRQAGWVRKLAASLVRDAASAEDVTQEALLAGLGAPRSVVQSEVQLRAWLAGVVRNLARLTQRTAAHRQQREQVAARLALSITEAEQGVDQVVERTAELRLVVLTLMQLKEPYRSTLLLRYFDGLSPAQIAEQTGTELLAVKKRLARGLERMRRQLDDQHGGERSAWCGLLVDWLQRSGTPIAVPQSSSALPSGLWKLGLAGVLGFGLFLGWRLWFAGEQASEIPAAPASAEMALLVPAAQGESSSPAGQRLAVVSPAAPPAPPAATGLELPLIRGRVLNSLGQPLADSLILATDQSGFPVDFDERKASSDLVRFQTHTDAAGRFELRGPRPGPLRLNVSAPGFAPLSLEQLRLPSGSSHDLGELRLTPGAWYSGQVLDADGRPLSGAEFVPQDPHLRGFGEQEFVARRPLAVSGAQGEFHIEQLLTGAWKLSVRTMEHPDWALGGLAERPSGGVAGAIVKLPQGSSISGHVYPWPPGSNFEAGGYFSTQPLSEALRISAWPGSDAGGFGFAEEFGREVRPDEAGNFKIGGLQPGQRYSVALILARSGLEPLPRDGRPWSMTRLRSPIQSVPAGSSGLELLLGAPASASFALVDSSTGAAVSGARVQLSLDRMHVRVAGTDAGAALEALAGDRWRVGKLWINTASVDLRLDVRAAGYREQSSEHRRLTAGTDLDLGVLRLEPAPAWQLEVQGADGLPLAGARVRLLRADLGEERGQREVWGAFEARELWATTTAASGHTSLPVLASALRPRARLVVEAPGYAALLENVPDQDAPAARTVVLRRGGSVLVRVKDQSGQPCGGLSLIERDAPLRATRWNAWLARPGDLGELVTDAQGAALFANIAPGQRAFGFFEASAWGELELSGWSSVEVREGETAVVEMRRPTSASLVGNVLLDGAPWMGASLKLAALAASSPGGLAEQAAQSPSWPLDLGEQRSTGTDGTGRYALEQLQPGSWRIELQAEGSLLSFERTVQLQSGENQIDLDLRTGGLRGRLLDQHGAPLAGLQVWAARQSFGFGAGQPGDAGSEAGLGGWGFDPWRKLPSKSAVLTDADGAFELSSLPSDRSFDLRVTGDHVRFSERRDLELAPGEQRELEDWTMEPAAALRIEIVDVQGRALVNQSLMLWPESQPEAVLYQYLKQEPLLIPGLQAGRWCVQRMPESASGPWGGPERGQPIRVADDCVDLVLGSTSNMRLVRP